MNKIFRLIKQEEKRQRETLAMIPSENYVSKDVLRSLGSVLTNKYSEGYPGKRYYQGNKIIDEIENLAINTAKELFGVVHVNVQPYSGSPANSAVLFALCNAGDTIMGLSLAAGGHLTHGHPDITFSGKYFKSIQFGVDGQGFIDYEEVAKLARREKPQVMIIGTTAYPLILNWQKFGKIADSVGTFLVADISHVAGLVVADAYPSPVKYAHVVTTTTHKTLRGPRGAMIMVTKKGIAKDPDLPGKIDRSVFPGLQGGPHDNTTAAIAQALLEDSLPSFKKYGQQVIQNAKVLADELKKGGLTLVCNGTESHLVLIDLRPQRLSGNVVAEALETAGIVANRNSVPHDNAPAFYPSGLRLGTPALTTRGMKEKEMQKITGWILAVIDHTKEEKLPIDKEARNLFLKTFKARIARDKFLKNIASQVSSLCKKFPME